MLSLRTSMFVFSSPRFETAANSINFPLWEAASVEKRFGLNCIGSKAIRFLEYIFASDIY